MTRAVGLRLDLAHALMLSGQLTAAGEVTAETAVRASASGDEVGALRARLLDARIAAHVEGAGTGSEGPSARMLAVAEEARLVFARAGNELALAEAWVATAYALLVRCHMAAMLEAVEHTLEHARRAGSTHWDGELPGLARHRYVLRPDSGRRGLALVRRAAGPASHRPHAAGHARGHARELRPGAGAGGLGGSDRQRSSARSSISLPAAWHLGGRDTARYPSAAERAVRPSCELLEELGEVGYRFVAVSQLAASLYVLGRLDEAEELTRAAETSAPSDDIASQMLWRQVRAQVLARRGERAEAERIARAAVALAGRTDMLNFQANSIADLAEVYALAGRTEEGRAQLRAGARPCTSERATSWLRRKHATGLRSYRRPRRQLPSNAASMALASSPRDRREEWQDA